MQSPSLAPSSLPGAPAGSSEVYLHYHMSQPQTERYSQALLQSWQQPEVQPLHPIRKKDVRGRQYHPARRGEGPLVHPVHDEPSKQSNTFQQACDANCLWHESAFNFITHPWWCHIWDLAHTKMLHTQDLALGQDVQEPEMPLGIGHISKDHAGTFREGTLLFELKSQPRQMIIEMHQGSQELRKESSTQKE